MGPHLRHSPEILPLLAPKMPDAFVIAHEIDPSFRVQLQGKIQRHIDSSISSTVNLPETATEDDVERIFLHAWRAGCKGITVYREGSREGILLSGPLSK